MRSAQTKIEQEIWQKTYRQARERGHSFDNARPELEPPPAQKRLLVTDATSEKQHELMMQNPQGLLVLRDELCGWMSDMDKPGRESDRGFALQSWSGNEGFSVDRIGRGSLHVPHVCLSVFGNVQPTRLQHYMSDTIAGGSGPNNDGLFQRFQILVYPDVSPDWKLVDRLPDANALATVQRVFSHLAELPCEALRLHFITPAQLFFNAWLGDLERELRSPGDLPPALVAHLAKYRGLLPRLAALYELSDRVAGGACFTAGQTLEISLEHASQAGAACKYLRSHARRIYGGMVSTDMAAARDLSEKLRQGKLTSPFTTRNVYRKCWAGMNTPERARRVLELLASFGWVRSIVSTEQMQAGRPTEFWAINPQVVSQ
jgi:putative DNA primase/helicase